MDRIKNQKEARLDDEQDELGAIQKLINIFLLLNVCHFVSIIGLWTLDRRQKRQTAELERRARLASVDNRSVEDEEEEDFDPEVPSSPKSRRNDSLRRKERLSESHSLQRREASSSSESPILPLASGHLPETLPEEEAQPLLNDEPLPYHAQIDAPAAGEALTRAERLRGEIFGVAGICLIAFAWIFFIGTAFLRLRAKKDRES